MGNIVTSFRLLKAGYILAREGVFAALPEDLMQGPAIIAHRFLRIFARKNSKNFERAENMSRAMNKLGPSYIKLGQFLATRPDIVGAEVAKDLSKLHDSVETFPQEKAVALIEGALGRKIDDLYLEFAPALAAASMAQVHKASIKKADGRIETVAVKVIRPGVRARFAKDLQAFYLVAKIQERYVPATRRLRPISVVDTLAQSTKIEMDLRLEAAALSELAENTQKDEGFRVPKVDWERTGRDVITMEWIDGIKMSDVAALRAAGFDLNALAVSLMQSFLRHTLRDGFFHADMHPGNLFVDKSGCIVAVDLGITGRLGKKEKRFLAEILYGFITRDYNHVARVHFEAGYVPHHHLIESFAQANRAIGEPIHGQAAETISMAKLLTLLFEVTELFDMQTRPELLLLQKTMVVVEGVSRSLDPNFNMWKAAEPVVKEWMAKNMGPVGMAKDLKEGAQSLLMLARKGQDIVKSFERVQKGMDLMAQKGVYLDTPTIQKLAKAQAKQNRFGRYSLMVIAVSLAIIAFKLL